MNAAQLEQWRALADEGGFFEGNAVILELIAEVERLQAQLAAVPVEAIHAACRAAENDGAEVGDVWEWLWEFAPNLYTLER